MIKTKVFYGVDPEPQGGGFYWPDSPSKRKELLSVKRNHPATYESVYQCRPGRRESSIFVESDFVYYQPPKRLEYGMADPEVAAFISKFYAIVAGWDTAFEATSQSDHTVGIVAGLLPCNEYHRGEDPLIYGECEPHLDVYLLDLVRKKLEWGDLVAEFRAFHRKWNISLNVVEKKGTGILLYQSMPAIGINVEGVVSNDSKRARAISGVEAGSTQGWFRQWRVRFPLKAPWLDTYKTELKDFTGEDDADDDQTDATVHLVNYSIQTGGGMALMSSSWAPDKVDNIIGEQESLPEPSASYLPARAEMLSWIQLAPEFSGDPFEDLCANCGQFEHGYCNHHKRTVVALDTCEHHEPVNAVMA